jgi:hypothetical protein
VGTGGSASGTGGVVGTGGSVGTGGATTACIPPATGGPSGMNTGRACVSCHGNGQAPAMTAGGSLYTDVNGTAAVGGATVTITDANGKVVKMVTGSRGNFYTGTPIAFPAKIQVSKCPDTMVMTALAASGDCNSCHKAGMRIHLP